MPQVFALFSYEKWSNVNGAWECVNINSFISPKDRWCYFRVANQKDERCCQSRFQSGIKCLLLEQETPEQQFWSVCAFLLPQNQEDTRKIQKSLTLAGQFEALVLARNCACIYPKLDVTWASQWRKLLMQNTSNVVFLGGIHFQKKQSQR